MLESGVQNRHPELKNMVVEASRALAQLDADRLEELALSCQALNRELTPIPNGLQARLTRQAREAAVPMEVFSRVLDATRANLRVMHRLREIRMGQIEYGERAAGEWSGAESVHGYN
ncbi:hypothetical protein ACOBR2_10115 [Telmatobacter bradus]|uniref:hypothetical protein n=1 Tax=Telmatobacter bradus TaxID=474953 RepID=UPI003B430B39